MEQNLYFRLYTSNVYKTKGFPILCQNRVSAHQLVTLGGNCVYELVDNYSINDPTKQGNTHGLKPSSGKRKLGDLGNTMSLPHFDDELTNYFTEKFILKFGSVQKCVG